MTDCPFLTERGNSYVLQVQQNRRCDMSLDKAIRSGKEHRKPYRGSKAVDPMCCNHGGCDYCLRSRTYRTQKEFERIRSSVRDAEQESTP